MTDSVWIPNEPNGGIGLGAGIFRYTPSGVPDSPAFLTNGAMAFGAPEVGLVHNGTAYEVWIVNNQTDVLRFGADGTLLGTLTNPAFDFPGGVFQIPGTGEVWINDGDTTIYRYLATGTDTGLTITIPGSQFLGNMCLGPEGAVWIAEEGFGGAHTLYRYNTDGTVYGGGPIDIAGERSTHGVLLVGATVWVVGSSDIFVLETSGALVHTITDPSGGELFTLALVGTEVWLPQFNGGPIYRYDAVSYALLGTITNSGFSRPYAACVVPGAPTPPGPCAGAIPGVRGATLDVPVGSPSHLPGLLAMVRPSINTDPAGVPAIRLTTTLPLVVTISGATLHVGVSAGGLVLGYDLDIAQATLCDVVAWLSPSGPIEGAGSALVTLLLMAHTDPAPLTSALLASGSISAMALVEMQATTTGTLILEMGTANPWCLLRTAALALDVLAADQAAALSTLQIADAVAPWLDYIGALYSNPRLALTTAPGGPQEPDGAYAVRVARDVLLPYANNVAMAAVIAQTTGLPTIITDNPAQPATFRMQLTGALPPNVTVDLVVALVNRYKALGPILTQIVERDAGVDTFMLSPHAATPGVLNRATSTLNEGLIVVWPS